MAMATLPFSSIWWLEKTTSLQPLPPLIAKPPSSAIPSASFTALAPTKYDMAWLASGRNCTSLALVGLKSTLP
eukprot:Skav213853  [mRNA]  locus=scaffold2366:147652:147870:+ [translate_table: standard]